MLGALQSGAVATGLPFTLVLLGMAYCLVKGLREEQRGLAVAKPA
ncbi:BCCT family transporter [Halomonas sp. KM-1]|nr:BCCT family transporter [Halomonas sp. KM-1]